MKFTVNGADGIIKINGLRFDYIIIESAEKVRPDVRRGIVADCFHPAGFRRAYYPITGTFKPFRTWSKAALFCFNSCLTKYI